ncbi:MAG: HAMP domain-containing protein [Coprothermobacterota bacterium]|nr:HAMP domain-containing protein [Coprothermobacterota bacterium]
MKFSSPVKIWKKPLTLKGRLVAISIIVLFLLNCFSLVFVNLAATFFITRYINFPFLGEPFPENFYTSSSISPQEGPSPAPSAVIQFVTPGEIIEARRLAQSILQNLRIFSIGLLLAINVLGGMAVYFLSKRTLRPLEEVSRAAKEISARSLNRRLSFQESTDEVKTLAEAFNTMLERLEKSFQNQERFSSSVAHELRTPLATMRTNLEVVLQDNKATAEDCREIGRTMEARP